MELHDKTIQSLYGIGLQLENCLELSEESVEELKRELDVAIDRLYEVISDVRGRIDDLRLASKSGVPHDQQRPPSDARR